LPDMIQLRDHGVDPRYLETLSDAGYTGLTPEQLLRTRDQGVDGSYIRGMADAGYKDVPLIDLVRARQHGVDGRSDKRINAKLAKPASLDQLIQIHDRGGLD